MCYNVLHSQMFLFLWQLEFRTPLARIFLALGVYQVRLNRKDLEPEYLKTLFPQEPWRRLCYLDTPSVKKVGRSGAGFCKRICTIYDRYTWYMSAYNRYIEIHIRIFTLKSGTGLVFGMLFFFLIFCLFAPGRSCFAARIGDFSNCLTLALVAICCFMLSWLYCYRRISCCLFNFVANWSFPWTAES